MIKQYPAAKLSFNNKNNQFFQSLKKSVDAYFHSNGLKKTGNWKLYSKTLVLIPGSILIYTSLMLFSLPVAISILLVVILGIFIASIGFNIMHDACHGSYSSKKWVNDLFGLTLNAVGGNAFIWKQKHNVIHHTYTNIEGLDEDIAVSKLIRQSPTQEWKPIHRFQHIYLTLAYSLTFFMWVGVNDFKKYFMKRILNTPLQRMSRKEHFIFWMSKLFYTVVYIVLPIIFVGWLPWLIGFVIMGLVISVVLAYTFQLAHAVEGPEFESAGVEDKVLETEWAVHQVKTTANFAPGSRLVSWFAGGLNFQIEHHLFPRISHIHYPQLSKIVKAHCQQFGLPYHSYPTVLQAVISHLRIMKKLGQKTAA